MNQEDIIDECNAFPDYLRPYEHEKNIMNSHKGEASSLRKQIIQTLEVAKKNEYYAKDKESMNVFYPPLASLLEIIKEEARADRVTPMTTFRFTLDVSSRMRIYDYQYLCIQFDGKPFEFIERLSAKHRVPEKMLHRQYYDLRHTSLESYKKKSEILDGIWTVVNTTEKVVIPSIIVENDPEMPTHSRFCVAYDLINYGLEKVARTLCHSSVYVPVESKIHPIVVNSICYELERLGWTCELIASKNSRLNFLEIELPVKRESEQKPKKQKL